MHAAFLRIDRVNNPDLNIFLLRKVGGTNPE
jgi:hypothetical protein